MAMMEEWKKWTVENIGHQIVWQNSWVNESTVCQNGEILVFQSTGLFSLTAELKNIGMLNTYVYMPSIRE